MKSTLTAGLIAALATPALAGGPVIVPEEPEVVSDQAGSGNLLVPLLLVLAIGAVIASDNGDDPVRPIDSSG